MTDTSRKPRVSVIIPTYNGERFIEEAIRSALQQYLPADEIIVVDDASTDRTVSIVRGLARECAAPIRLVRAATNSGGPSAPMNVGVSQASGELIALLDHDDIMAPRRIQACADLLSKYPQAALAVGWYQMMDFDGIIRPVPEAYKGWPQHSCELAADEVFSGLTLEGYFFGGAGGMVFRKRVWEQVGRFTEKLRIAWDFHFALEVTRRGWPVAYIPESLFYHRLHEQNLEKRDSGRLVAKEVTWALKQVIRSADSTREQIRLAREGLAKRLDEFAYSKRRTGEYREAAKYYLTAVGCGVGVTRSLAGVAKTGIEALRCTRRS